MKPRSAPPRLAALALPLLAVLPASAQQGIRAQPLGTETPAAVRPAAPKEELLEYADLLFTNSQHALAARQYQLFLQQHPRSPNAAAGWFRLGECYLQVGQEEDAATTFKYVADTYRQGPFAGSSAYRLAVLRYNAQDFAAAAPYFSLAVSELASQEAALQARFYLARCLHLLDRAEDAIRAYQAVLAAPAPAAGAEPAENPFRERSLLELARLHYDVGQAPEAFARFEELALSTADPAAREEAYARAGLLASELGDQEKSQSYLAAALEGEGDSPWKAFALVGLIFSHFAQGEHDKVIGLYSSSRFNAPEDTRPRMLLVVGHSYRLTDDLQRAAETYELVESSYRELPEGAEAGYHRLQCLKEMGDGGLGDHVGAYVERQRSLDPESEFIDLALLVRAEWHFAKAQSALAAGQREEAASRYADAAADYAAARGPKIPERFLEQRLYKLGWSQSESGDHSGAIASLGEFLRAYPGSDLLPSALAKRAETHQALEDYTAAIGDFRDLVASHPQAREAEYSLQQVALIHAQRREVPEMITAYRELLRKFPETSAAPEARYWIGVGLFEQEQYVDAVPELDAARSSDPENYAAKASLRIILCHYQAEDLDALADEAFAYLEASKGEERPPIPPQVHAYLGNRLFERRDYSRAELFLTAASTPGSPDDTSPDTWNMLGQSRLELGRHAAAVDPLQHYLSRIERPSLRAEAQLDLGRAYLAMGEHDQAMENARASLTSLKEGRVNAEARILSGDIAAAQGDPAAAAREYLVVSQIFGDPEITPGALAKAAAAFRLAGDPAKAAELEAQLLREFPGWQPPAGE